MAIVARIYASGGYSARGERIFRALMRDYAGRRPLKWDRARKRTTGGRLAHAPMQTLPHGMEAGYFHPEYKH